ncbi:MAG: WD40 repeat domain-containing protein [Chloroflexi bacterium]|nr:WD40 repeat domain-containing protein [Chloroflexota bacterium]
MISRQTITSQTAQHVKAISQAAAGFISRAAWSPDGAILAVAHGEEVSLWLEGFTPEPTRKIKHPAPVKALAFTPDGTAFATGSSDMLVRLWSAVETFVLVTFRGHHGSVESVALSPSGRLLASCGGDRTIRLVDMTDSIGSTILHGHTSDISGAVFNSAGTLLASGGWDCTVRFWDIAERSERASFTYPDWIRDLAVTHQGDIVAAACKDGSVHLFDFASRQEIGHIAAHAGGADSLAFSPDGSILATGGRDNTVRLWDWRGNHGTPLATLTGHSRPVLTVAFHPAGTLLVSGGGDNVIKLWSVADASSS